MPIAATASDLRAETSGFLLERTARRMKQYVQECLQQAQAGITVDQWLVLQELHRRDGQSQWEIAQAIYKDAPTMTRIIDLLCEKGLTRRQADTADRRRFCISLTAEGRQKIAEVLPVIHAARRHAWAVLSDAQITELEHLLNLVFEHLNPPA